MSSREYAESEGDFKDWKPAAIRCPNDCGAPNVYARKWHSNDGAYVDTQLRCRGCGHTWWVDGDDG